ncbi:acetolactate synthase small subunit [Buchnera aphidicola]|uniref:Acetolactate synthase small subunit n=1 Tax=Buchnera aphidicola (Stegophylla sp.) TaxID=2315800 RepID=A0A4D6YA82_9GAMM|nr:acetolactate synthase small subunit [Buchnera aphidicola (Stegophylla sp.)]QCI26329.1 acetolactate synthase small subunit [Buchnera aphidicola (Stegophylla sp.)]
MKCDLKNNKKTILSILLENESGSLSRIIGLFTHKGYHIESMNVNLTNKNKIFQVIIKTIGNQKTIEQIEKQLYKLINVLQVIKIIPNQSIEREIMIIKIHNTNKEKKIEIYQIIKIFKGRIIHFTLNEYIIQISGTQKKINTFIKIIKNISKITTISRSSIISINK